MVFEKRGSSSTVFWSIFLFILIIVVVIFIFFYDSFKDQGIERINLRSEEIFVDLNNIKSTQEGVEFILKISPEGRKVTRVEFSFENNIFLKEVYSRNVSYIQNGQYLYSIELKEIKVLDIRKIYILPTFEGEEIFSIDEYKKIINYKEKKDKSNETRNQINKNINDFSIKVKEFFNKNK